MNTFCRGTTKFILRTVALLTVMVFSFTTIAWADGVNLISSIPAKKNILLERFVSHEAVPSALQIAIPEDLARIEKIYAPHDTSSQSSVLVIQDAHADASIQMSIRALLDYLKQNSKKDIQLLLEGAPEWLDVQMMQDRIVAGVPGVSEIHHVHLWGLTPQELMLTMHMSVTENTESQSDVIRAAKQFLKDEYGIGHATIEVDVGGCSDH